MARNLDDGGFRLCIAVDEITDEFKSIVELLKDASNA